MGILTDVKRRKEIVGVLVKHGWKLSVLSYIVGIVWFCALADPSLNAKTYFSENALLPGLVQTEYKNHAFASRHYRELISLSPLKSIPAEWLLSKMSEIGLASYQQNFTAYVPFADHGDTSVIRGTNVYGILHAPRIAQTEAMVLSAPYLGGKNMGAIALMLSIADHCRKKSYWSKDIIFIVTEKGEIGMQAWLAAYYAIPSSYIKSAPLQGHAGSIQAAINLEMSSDKVNHFDILIEGINGQLPNLDLVNMVVKLSRKENIPAALHTQAYDHLGSGNWYDFLHALTSMFMMMCYQAAGLPTANHGLYYRYRIEALTLRGVHDRAYAERGFRDTGTMLEGIYRSLNNLLEKFHQSFFFYILPSTNRYVSIGLYMPPYCTLLLGPLITAIVLWTKGGADPSSDKDATNPELKEKVAFWQNPPQVGRVIPVLMMAQLMGALQFYSPDVGYRLAKLLEQDEIQCTLASQILTFLFSVALPFSLRSPVNGAEGTLQYHAMLKCAALILFSVVMSSIAAVNISLAFFVAVFTVPAVLFVTPTKSKLRRCAQALLLLMVSPLAILFLVIVGYNAVIMSADEALSLSLLFSASLDTLYRSLLSAIRDRHLLGTWSYSIACVALFPNWWMFWYLTLRL